MDFSRAFAYVFDDPNWLNKATVIAGLTFMSVVLMPVVFVGLLPFCVLLGYLLEIVNNVRDEKKIVLPVMNAFAKRFNRGAGVLLAVIAYNIPLMLFGLCIGFVPGMFQDDATNGIVTLTALCCLGPLTLLYVCITWPILGAGLARYARGAPTKIFFHTGLLWEEVQNVGAYTVQWLLYIALTNLIFVLVGWIPCFGWLLVGTLLIPVHGHLLGQYARQIDLYKKRNPPVRGRA